MFTTVRGMLPRTFYGFMILLVLVPLSGMLAPAAANAADRSVRCVVERPISDSIDPSRPDDRGRRIYGELCAPQWEAHKGITVQFLIHGATDNHTYWDFTVDGLSYSYARDAAARGFPTFAIDQIGYGQSSKPVGSQETIEVAAFVDHQVVQGLKNGSITGTRFGKVIEMGHSFGSIATLKEAITYGDVAGVIITGELHHFTQTDTTALQQDFSSANQA